MKADRGITIGRLALGAGVNLETVRYYESIGLMPKPERNAAGHRRYSAKEGHQLKFIRRARELGFGLDDIRALISLATPERVSCGEVQVIAEAHLANVRAKIADLIRLEAALAEAVDRCEGGGSTHCPVIEVLAG